ncbi:MAG: hypothetical protein M3N22_04425 [Acidobacteriota bacterium]|nr:hypothetical protein [Acidobacteriota bacterium]
MAHTYMHFDFGADEEKAQEARHKLDVWKQAFRLDKKLQYKLDRPDDTDTGADAQENSAQESAAHNAEGTENPKSKSKSQSRKSASKHSSSKNDNGNVSLLVRLYFSSHEKLSEQRWLDRIPTEEPFKSASPKVLRQGDSGFDRALKQFADLD